ncbi:MAG TPA: polysaccharide biosynthesis tyrosine autokinase [Caulobacteraceae bacterium]|nr:polysaccharide biosynthesis tyrosine autokinase [Caulobacteraceae bacterium]
MKFGEDPPNWPPEPQPPAPLRGPRRDLAPYGALGVVQAESEFEEGSGLNLLHYLHILLKWKAVIIGAGALGLIVGLVATLLTTPMYRSSSTIKIDREPVKVLNSDGVQPREQGGEEFYQTEYGLLRSRDLAERTVTKFNLADNPSFMAQAGGKSLLHRGGSGDVMKLSRAQRVEIATNLVMNGLLVEPIRPSRLVRLTYQSPNGALAAEISNDIGEAFLEYNLVQRFAQNDYARKFLQDRLEQTRQKLEQSENALVEYERSQRIIEMAAPSKGDAAADTGATSLQAMNLAQLNAALAQATNERVLAEQKYRQAQSNPAMVNSEIGQSSALTSLRARRLELSSQYQQNSEKYQPSFPEQVALKARIDDIDKAIAAEQNNIRDSSLGGLQAKYEVAQRQEQSLAAKVEQAKAAFFDLRDRTVQYNILQRDAQQNRTQYQDLLERTKSVSVAGAIDANNISIVDRARPAGAPFKPRPAINLAFSLMLGLLIGGALAIGLEQLDDSIKSPEDVDSKLGVPLLGAIPVLDKGLTAAEALADPRSAVSEAYYSVRTALQFSTNEGVPPNLLVTSARPSEGKSTTAMALAQNFARLGLRTLLIDADLRNPSLHKVIGRNNSAGLSNLLTGAQPLAEVLQATDDPNLSFLACGPLPPNPAELLAGNRARQLLQQVGQEFDQVIIDGPPVMGLADAPLLSSVAAGTVLIIAAGSTRRGLARAALKRLHLSHARILGAVLTKFNARRTPYGYGYGYGSAYAYAYDYGAKPEPEPKRIGVGDFLKRSGRGR